MNYPYCLIIAQRQEKAAAEAKKSSQSAARKVISWRSKSGTAQQKTNRDNQNTR